MSSDAIAPRYNQATAVAPRYSQETSPTVPYSLDAVCFSASTTETALAKLRARVARLPPSVNGMALGLCGLAGAWDKMGAIHGVDVDAFVVGLVLAASLVQMAYLPLKIATCFEVFLSELSRPRDVAAIAASPMALCFIGAQVHKRIDEGLGTCVVALGGVLQVVCMAHFFYLVAKLREKPEPFWFPPTVSVAMTAIQANACGWDPVIHQSCFYAAIAIMLGILPFASYRVARHPSTVAVGPTCNILCAPASLNSLAWHLVTKPAWPGQAPGPWLGLVLFAASTTFFLQALLGLVLRRRFWATEPFSPSWSAFTFPLASTTSAALYAYQEFFPDNRAFEVYHWLLFAFCNVVIVYTNVMFFTRLPSWLQGPEGSPVSPAVDNNGSISLGREVQPSAVVEVSV